MRAAWQFLYFLNRYKGFGCPIWPFHPGGDRRCPGRKVAIQEGEEQQVARRLAERLAACRGGPWPGWMALGLVGATG